MTPAAAAVPLLTQQHSTFPAAASALVQQLVQNVIQLQSGALPLTPQSDQPDALTVPSKSIPQLKWGVPGLGIIEWLPVSSPNTVG